MEQKLIIPFNTSDVKKDIASAKRKGRHAEAKELENKLKLRVKASKDVSLEKLTQEIETQNPTWKVYHGWGRTTAYYNINCDGDNCQPCRIETAIPIKKENYRLVLREEQINIYLLKQTSIEHRDIYLFTYVSPQLEVIYEREKQKLMK